MAMEEMVKQIAEAVEKEGNSRAVFGEPMKLETKTVIPVAAIQLAGGGGVGGSPEKNGQRLIKAIFGGGGGGGFDVHPVGFIHERNGEVVFTPIHLDVRGKPYLTEASAGIGRAIDTLSTAVATLTHRRKTNGAPAKA
jgi:uncharacterized spore protein YtfJ